jgi:hypothetical protein
MLIYAECAQIEVHFYTTGKHCKYGCYRPLGDNITCFKMNIKSRRHSCSDTSCPGYDTKTLVSYMMDDFKATTGGAGPELIVSNAFYILNSPTRFNALAGYLCETLPEPFSTLQ